MSGKEENRNFFEKLLYIFFIYPKNTEQQKPKNFTTRPIKEVNQISLYSKRHTAKQDINRTNWPN